MKAKDIKAAKQRGLLSRKEAKRAIAVAGKGRHRRTCVACGLSFLPPDRQRRMFGCACCATAWGFVKETLDRSMPSGARVVRWSDGALGTIIRVPDAGHALARFGEEEAQVTVREVERLAELAVEHLGRCNGHGSGAVPGGIRP